MSEFFLHYYQNGVGDPGVVKVPPEEVSGMIADVIEPFENLKSDVNLSTLTHKDTKENIFCNKIIFISLLGDFR